MAHLRYWRRDIDESNDLDGDNLQGKHFNILSNFYLLFF